MQVCESQGLKACETVTVETAEAGRSSGSKSVFERARQKLYNLRRFKMASDSTK